VGVITLLTDFGLADSYVGEVKAVLLRASPGATLVDLTHGIAPGSVREGAWVLRRTWSLFPAGTCHLAVVDPGVGGVRRGLAVAAGGHFFVGPDNGLLAPAWEAAGVPEIRQIDVREVDLTRRGTTFDGRDVFAPVAGRLATGGALVELGPEVDDPVALPSFRPVLRGPGLWELEVAHVDRFGNLVTVAEESFLREAAGEEWREVGVRIGEESIHGIRLAYDDVDPGAPLLTIGGAGTLEVCVNRGSAKRRFGLGAGSRVTLEVPGASLTAAPELP